MHHHPTSDAPWCRTQNPVDVGNDALEIDDEYKLEGIQPGALLAQRPLGAQQIQELWNHRWSSVMMWLGPCLYIEELAAIPFCKFHAYVVRVYSIPKGKQVTSPEYY